MLFIIKRLHADQSFLTGGSARDGLPLEVVIGKTNDLSDGRVVDPFSVGFHQDLIDHDQAESKKES